MAIPIGPSQEKKESSASENKYLLWAVFVLLLIFSAYFSTKLRPYSDDIQIYYNAAYNYFHGLMPFINFNIEYPPGAFPFMAIPYLLGKTLLGYRIVFAIEAGLFAILGGAIIFRKKGAGYFLLYMICLMLTEPSILFQRLDMIVGVITLMALIFLTEKRLLLAFILLSIAVSIKLYPIVLLPFFIIFLPKIKEKLAGCLIFMVTLLLIFLPFLAPQEKNGDVFYFWKYNQKRGIEIGSSWSSLAFSLRAVGQKAVVYFSFGSRNVASPQTETYARLAIAFVFLSLLALFLYFLFKMPRDESHLFTFSFLAIALFIIFNKVFSPQFMLWLIPLLPFFLQVYSKKEKKLLASLFLAILFLTFLIFPTFFVLLAEQKAGAVIILILRNLFFLIFVVLSLFYIIRNKNKSLSLIYEKNNR